MTIVFRLAAALLAAVASGEAIAQQYPARAIRFLVGSPPGSGNDQVSRLLGQMLAERLGQPVVVEQKPGAAGLLANEALAKSARSSSSEARSAVCRWSSACPRLRTSSTNLPTAAEPASAPPRIRSDTRSARRARPICQFSFHETAAAAIRSKNPRRSALTRIAPEATSEP